MPPLTPSLIRVCEHYGELRLGPPGWREGLSGYRRFLGVRIHAGGVAEIRGLTWRPDRRAELWPIAEEMRRHGFRAIRLERHDETGGVRKIVTHEL
jgi:hypothetical protein